jgi:hypothetical protein
MGPDLVVRRGEWMAHPERNFSNSLRRRPAEIALPYLKRIYRTLLSRGMESCGVYSTDGETREWLEAQILHA